MRKTGRTKALLAMFLAAASLQAGTAFGAQAAIGSQLQAGTWVKEDAGWKYRKPSGEMATGWVHTASGWYYLQPETGIMATGMLRINDRTYYFNQTPDAVEGKMVTLYRAGGFLFISCRRYQTDHLQIYSGGVRILNVQLEDEVTEPSEEDKEDTAEEPAEDKPEEDASEDKDSEDKDTEETPAEEDKEDASEDNNSEDSNEDVSEDNAADDVAEDTEATETEGEI